MGRFDLIVVQATSHNHLISPCSQLHAPPDQRQLNLPFVQTETIVASTPTERFTDHTDGTVSDTETGRMWKVYSEGQSYMRARKAVTYTWQLALQQATVVNAAGFAGQNDWRLPNLKELSSIVERQCIEPAINLEVFPSPPLSWFWSDSPYAGYSDSAWSVGFGNGSDDGFSKVSNHGVRLVRGGH